MTRPAGATAVAFEVPPLGLVTVYPSTVFVSPAAILTVAVSCVPARFTPVTVAVTAGSATALPLTKFVTVDVLEKPDPLITMV
jgi:hypothetical protein